MQITIKTLQNSVFKIECELEVDVTELKKKIEEQGKTPQDYPTERQKLIYQVDNTQFWWYFYIDI